MAPGRYGRVSTQNYHTYVRQCKSPAQVRTISTGMVAMDINMFMLGSLLYFVWINPKPVIADFCIANDFV